MSTVLNNMELDVAAYNVIEKLIDLPSTEQHQWLLAECKGNAQLFEKCIELLAYQTDDTQFADMIYADLQQKDDDFDPAEKQMGDYQTVKRIGRGGTAEVFLAIRKGDEDRTPLALKLMHCWEHTQELAERFRQEQTILAQFAHPNIAKFMGSGTTKHGRPFFVMEFVEGIPITQYCKENKLSLNARLQLLLRVCSAVSAAHRSHTLHRDLKPSNILVSKEGIPKLLDFGIAKTISSRCGDNVALTEFFSPMTPQYASPEQIKQKNLSFASDQYSLGILLYELITEELPFQKVEDKLMHVTCGENIKKPSERLANKSSHELMKRQGSIRKTVAALDAIVMKATDSRPEKRYESVSMLADDVERCLSDKAVLAQKVPMLSTLSDLPAPKQIAAAVCRLFCNTARCHLQRLRSVSQASSPL